MPGADKGRHSKMLSTKLPHRLLEISLSFTTASSPTPSKFYFCGSTKKPAEDSTSDNNKTNVVVHQQVQSVGPYFYSEEIKNVMQQSDMSQGQKIT